MNERYRLIQRSDRGGMCYCVDTETGVRTSLETKDRAAAQRLVHHKNEALKNPQINRQIGMSYLSADDPSLVTRVWDDVMSDIIKDKTGPTLHRWKTAIKDEAFDLIRKKVVVTTTSDEFKAVLRAGTVSTNVYLRRLQNYAVDMNWLPKQVLPKRLFPKIKHKPQRGIRTKIRLTGEFKSADNIKQYFHRQGCNVTVKDESDGSRVVKYNSISKTGRETKRVGKQIHGKSRREPGEPTLDQLLKARNNDLEVGEQIVVRGHENNLGDLLKRRFPEWKFSKTQINGLWTITRTG